MRWSTTVMTGALVLALAGCGSEQPQVLTPPTPEPAATGSPATTARPVATAQPQDVDAVVSDFLGALGGDMPRAWELLSARSQQSFGAYDRFADLATEYAEGLANFGEVPRTQVELDDGLSVVVLAGEVTREGMTETDAVALPVRSEQGRPRVELASPSLPATVDIEVPAVGSGPLPRGTALRAFVPAGAREVLVVVDGEEVEAQQRPADGDRSEVTATPDLAPGPHVLAVIAVRADDLVVARAAAFTIQG